MDAPRFQATRCDDQRRPADAPARHAVVVVGAGPVGLSLAIDLAQRGRRVVLLDRDQRLSDGSRAICFAKRTLEIFDGLGVGDAIVDRGVRWQRGKVFFGDRLVYAFDLLPEQGHERPAFVNIAQHEVEARLVERAQQLPDRLELRWAHRVAAVAPRGDHVRLAIDTPDGPYALDADWLVACDGARSPVRAALGAAASGRVFHDRFLIADIRMRAGDVFADGAAERWFWFDPPFHRGGSVLLHSQPDDIWRVDFQLGPDADPDAEKQPERIAPRVRALLQGGLGRDVDFELVWASVYTFACQRMARFRHGRVLFAGDAAHGVSPFGARGANSGIQDADNLGWKLAAVLSGSALAALLDSYAAEREAAADENILHSTRSTDFITPKSAISRVLRDAVLDLAREHGFARRLVNSGRLSTPTLLQDSALNTADEEGAFSAGPCPGSPAVDAPLAMGRWLLRELPVGFCLLHAGPVPPWTQAFPLTVLSIGLDQKLLAQRYDLREGTAYLLRPDRHVCARWRAPTRVAVEAAFVRAHGR